MKIFKKEPNFKFMNRRGYAFLFSGLIIAVGIFLFYSHGFNLGVDFTGGTNIEVSFRENISVNKIRAVLSDVGLGKSMIQKVGEGQNKFFIKATEVEEANENNTSSEGEEEQKEANVTKLVEKALKSSSEQENITGKIDLNNTSEKEIVGWLVSKGVNRTTSEETALKIIELRNNNTTGLVNNFQELESIGIKAQALNVLKEHTYLGNFTFLSVEMVGPQVGVKMREKVTLATIWAMLGMLIYIAVRFQLIYGIAAVITLLHDVLITLTFILLFKVEMSLPVVAAILTIVGYSLNDTIVIFDRVRDNVKAMRGAGAGTLLNKSLNQTLSRTIMTSGTTLVVVMALFLFGGEVIHAFSFTLLVGVIFGTYSSIYQSCAWLHIWERKFLGAKKK